MAKRATIDDVARQAGVSAQTVSRAVNGKGEISEETRQRVLAVIDALDYRPSSIARGLATNRTQTIALVVPDIANPFFPEIARGAEEAARAAGYSLLLGNTTEDPAREAEVLAALEDRWVDGLILCSSRIDDDTLCRLLARQRAVVLVNRPMPRLGRAAGVPLGSVRVDDALGARLAVEHLAARGRGCIGLLAGPRHSYSGRARAQGYEAGLAQAGLDREPDLRVVCSPDLAGGLVGARELLTTQPDLDALLCFNDLVAVGALQACAALGRWVPEDVAVVGADDIPLAALVTPPLTTIHVSQREIGARSVRALLQLINRDDAGRRDVVIRPEVVVRGST